MGDARGPGKVERGRGKSTQEEALLMPLPACLSAEPVPEVVGTGQKPGRVACSSESRQKGIRPCVSELSWDSERAKARGVGLASPRTTKRPRTLR